MATWAAPWFLANRCQRYSGTAHRLLSARPLMGFLSAAAPAETRTSEVATNVTPAQIENLPTTTRNFLDLAALARAQGAIGYGPVRSADEFAAA